jgi:hypothetical protein
VLGAAEVGVEAGTGLELDDSPAEPEPDEPEPDDDELSDEVVDELDPVELPLLEPRLSVL